MTTPVVLNNDGKIAVKFNEHEHFEIYGSLKDLRDSIKQKKRSNINSFNYSYDDIHTLHCRHCHFRTLFKLPKRLVELDCSHNEISKLPTIPKTVKILKLGNCHFRTLFKLPKRLVEIDCSHNEISKLPTIPKTVKILKLGNCKNVKKLKKLPDDLKVLDFSNCSVEKVKLPLALTELYANDNRLVICPKFNYGLKKCYLARNRFIKPYTNSIPSTVTDTDCMANQLLRKLGM